jgi:periplasmic divalent cation tolerance protein
MTQAALVEIVTTVSKSEDALRLARILVEERAVACAHLTALRSIYVWKGELRDEPEYEIRVKTLASLASFVERRIAELHPYATPAILRVAIDRANPEYFEWVCESVRPTEEDR